MKRLFWLLVMALAIISCSYDGTDDGIQGGGTNQSQNEIIVVQTDLNFNKAAGVQTVAFSSPAEWRIQLINTPSDDWCSVTPTSGVAGNAAITINIEPNSSPNERFASIIIKSGTLRKTIKVTQEQTDALSVTIMKHEVAAVGDTVSIEVNANIDFTYAIDNQAQDWITYQTTRAMKTSNLIFAIAANESEEKRQGTVTISAGKFKKIVTIYQEDNKYESSDYSRDGEVTTLQTATKGCGIDLVLMGDAYTDRRIADGTYDHTMNTAMEKFFSVEPYKTFREYFNVYSVKAISKNEVYDENSETVFSCTFGEGTRVSGVRSEVLKYGLKAISKERMDEAMLAVIMNSTAHAGTCYIYQSLIENDYGTGMAIAYFPVGADYTAMERVLHHEVGGHGFAKLNDEYFYESNGSIPSAEIMTIRDQQTNYGWWKNIDFTSDTSTILWAKFIADERYANEKLGAYEGADTYWTGVWRPTENSIMRYNTGGFNAPSREAIYYRIHKLAYGDSWTYDYETFVEYDAINREVTTTTQSASRPMIYKPTTPPVVMNKSWRDELR